MTNFAAAAGERVAQHYERYASQYEAVRRHTTAVMFREFASKARAGKQNDFIRRVERLIAHRAA